MIKQRDLMPIQKLYEWSQGNYETGVSPLNVFMDLIGYSEDRYGENTYQGKEFSDCLGYLELCMLADALKAYENRGHDDVYEMLDYLLHDDEDLEEYRHEYASANAY
tara:strand:+ start:360 stop:680 length:321 start_codon:yes stop_codon:yes gene_type:complete